MKNPKDDMELEVMEAFASTKSDEEIGMPDVEQELTLLKARKNQTHISPFRQIAASVILVLAIGGIAVAAVANRQAIADFFVHSDVSAEKQVAEIVSDNLRITPSDSIVVNPGVIMFENAELVEIMTSISNSYKVEVIFRDEALKSLHLHFQYNTDDKFDLILESLNMFEKIRIKMNDGKLVVE